MSNRLLSKVAKDDSYEPSPPWACSEADVERWNREWLRYLGREWNLQLASHTAYPLTPELPSTAIEMIDLQFGWGPRWALYCDRDALLNRRVMEMGCGCGNLGKLLGRYVHSYLGTDFSTLSLAVARLVSPANCSYIHLGDSAALSKHHGRIDTIVGRYFWIHQNFKLARLNLEFLSHYLAERGRIYADFYWPNPDRKQGKVFRPEDDLSMTYPSATFRYTDDDVRKLIEPFPLQIVGTEISMQMQRMYVILERST